LYPGTDTIDKLFSIVIRADGGVPALIPNTPAEVETWPTLPALLANPEGPKALKDLLAPSFVATFCLLPTAAQMGIFHPCYDLLSPKLLNGVSTLLAMGDSHDRVGAQLFQSLFIKLMSQKKTATVLNEAKRIENCALQVAISSCCLAMEVSLVLVYHPYTGPIPKRGCRAC
jgi:hypothetical protein